MSTFRNICLLCQARQAVLIPRNPVLVPQWPQHAVRFASTARPRRRRPARMVLSPTVAKSTAKYGEDRKPSFRFDNSPFGGMNQTRARLRDKPLERSQAEIHRSSSHKPKKDEKRKEDRPLFHALKMQEALATIPYERRNALKASIGNMTSFDQFRLLPAVREGVKTALARLEELSPTPIQRLAIRELLKGPAPKRISQTSELDDADFRPKFEQFLLAAETGSGKTLAYAIPVVDAVKRAELEQKQEDEAKQMAEAEAKSEKPDPSSLELEPPEVNTAETSTIARPRAIILVPTSELVSQVGHVVKQLSHSVKFRSALISSSYTPRRIRNSLLRELDVIVTTPHLIASIAEADPYVFCRVTHLVIDEADSLFDKSFAPSTMKVIERTAPTLKKLILCSATIPRSLDSYLRSHFPEIKRLVTPNLHAIPRRVQLGVVDVDKPPYQGNRNMACADVIWSLGKAGSADDDMAYKLTGTSQPKNIIVFVNKRETAEEVAQYLVSKGVNAVALSRDMAEKRQKEIMAEFTILPPLPSPEDAKMLRKSKSKYWSDIPFETADSKSRESVKRLENTNVLVVTDLGSRGIDTVTVKTVILYDVPHTSIDFIHRLGRVGRMNRRGRGVVLVGKKDRKDIVREVREAMFKGQALI